MGHEKGTCVFVDKTPLSLMFIPLLSKLSRGKQNRDIADTCERPCLNVNIFSCPMKYSNLSNTESS